MQTFRECQRGIEFNFENDGPFTCDNPLITADLVLAVGENGLGVLQKAGANRTVTFAGAHGQIGYSVQLCPGETSQGLFGTWVVNSALMVLPLQENNSFTPAVLPNLCRSRSMLSVVYNTQSDSERRILWYRQDRLFWTNVVTPGGASTGCTAIDPLVETRLEMIGAVATAIDGRTRPEIEAFRVKARARLTEREGLFLIRSMLVDMDQPNVGVFALTCNSYLRFAVK